MKIYGSALKVQNEKVISELNLLLPRISAKDHTIWGANTEAKNRLGWLDLPFNSRSLLTQFDAHSAWAKDRGLVNVVLCGMGGSSLAAEVIAKSEEKSLTILDSTEPDQIRNSIPSDLKQTLIIISSKSGTTVETISHFNFFEQLYLENELDPTSHIIVLTDPETDLNFRAKRQGYRVFETDLTVGGRFSALSAFGLLPASLIGIDVSVILDDAQSAHELVQTPNSPAVLIASTLFTQTKQFINIYEEQSNLPGLGDWIEQLIAESTGKNGIGRLPVISPSLDNRSSNLSIGFKGDQTDITVEATLGEHFVLWEWVTVLLSYLLKVDPFDQPNVSESKQITIEILKQFKSKSYAIESALMQNEFFDVFSNRKVRDFEDFLKQPIDYLAVMAFLPRDFEPELSKLIHEIRAKLEIPVTFGWGPRYLHSTGQFHKGGQANGGFIQITQEVRNDLSIPNQDFSFGQLVSAQALGDAQALNKRDLPLYRIHLKQGKEALLKLFP